MSAGAVFTAATGIFVLAIPMILIAGGFDRRRLDGDLIWSKPFKFALSLAFHFGSFALVMRFMPSQAQDAPGLRSVAWIAAAAGWFELGYISIQAARFRHSHFNSATMIEASMAALMGVGAILILIPGVFIGILMASAPMAVWPLSLRIGVAIGFIGGVALTLVTGMAMGARRSRFAVAQEASVRPMRLTGWSLNRADLRPAHFLAAHMVQIVPTGALLASLCLPAWAAVLVTMMIGLGWGGLTLLAFRAALAGRSLPPPFAIFAQA